VPPSTPSGSRGGQRRAGAKSLSMTRRASTSSGLSQPEGRLCPLVGFAPARDSQLCALCAVSHAGREKAAGESSCGSSANSSAAGRGIIKNAKSSQGAETAHASDLSAPQAAPTREPVRVIPKTIRVDASNGMSYRRGGGFSALKQLAVTSLGERAEKHEGIQALISCAGDVRLPRSPRGRRPEESAPPPVKTESKILGFDGLAFQRVPSNEWLNTRDDLFRMVPAHAVCEDEDNGMASKHDVHFLREEEERVATARSGASSSRPHSSSQGPRASPLDKQVNNLEKQINYLLPKPLLPEVYQQVWTITSMVCAPEYINTQLRMQPS
jgi:hypothetical protein